MIPFPASLPGPSDPDSPAEAHTPIVFVHGNGDSGALWHTTVWRYESNGWPRHLLHAIDMPYPLAREDDEQPEPGRSSTAEHMRHLAAEVDAVLRATGAHQVALVANSRGGYAVRNYIANGGGAARVTHAVLGGTPNHGVWALSAIRPGSEFNGAGPFLMALNKANQFGLEVTPGVAWLTLRSDHNDKHAQPTGDLMGFPGVPTNVDHDGPALRGAINLVLAGVDHRETSFCAEAFAQTFHFIQGRAPATLDIVPEPHPRLDGRVFGRGVDNLKGMVASNLPLVGASVEVYATHADTGQRLGPAVHRRTVDTSGHWGPFEAEPGQAYEFVVTAEGYAVTHVYRSPFPRSSSLVHLQAERPPEDTASALSTVTLSRPRGYFDRGRDHISLDGESPPPGVPAGVATASTAHARITDVPGRTVVGEFNGERIAGLAWPAADGHVVTLELHH